MPDKFEIEVEILDYWINVTETIEYEGYALVKILDKITLYQFELN